MSPSTAQVGWTNDVVGNALELDGEDDHLSASDLDLRTDGRSPSPPWGILDRSADCTLEATRGGQQGRPDPGECLRTAVSLDGVFGR